MFCAKEIQSMNELEYTVYEYVLQHKNAVAYMRIRELASEVHVSTTTILHFCRKMGCGGFTEFKKRLKEYNGQNNMQALPEEPLDQIFGTFSEIGFQKKMNEAVGLISRSERILFVGIGNSGYIGEYGARYFTNLGKFTLFVSDPFYPMNMSEASSSVAIVLSVSGETNEIRTIVKGLKRSNYKIISITNSANCTVAKYSDINIAYHINMIRGESNLDFTTQVPALYLIETLGKRVRARLLEE